MPGSKALSGELNEKAVAMLETVTEILEKYQVRYMLDCGTLLGIVREQRILPWDDDMDISVRYDSLKALKKVQYHLWLKGFRARMIKSAHSYGPIEKGAVRILKVKDTKGLRRGDLQLDIFVKYPDENGTDLLMVGGDKTPIIQAFDGKYFDQLTYVNFEGKNYPIPTDFDGYLTARYGDWRTPVKDWNYLEDDQSKITDLTMDDNQ